jgi:hypothetical protein
MKNKIPVTIMLFLFLLASCGQKKLSEVIVGEWKVQKVEFPEMKIAESIIEHFRDEMLSSVYTFKENGDFELRSGLIPDGAKGKWRAKDESGEIFFEYTARGQQFPSTYQIKIIDENTISFKQKLGGDLGSLEATLVRK